METTNQTAAGQPDAAELIANAEAYSASLTEALGEQSSQLLDLYGALIEQTLDAAIELYDLLVNGDAEEYIDAVGEMKEEVLESLRQKIAEVTPEATTTTTNEQAEATPATPVDNSLPAVFQQSIMMGLMNEVQAHKQFRTILEATSVQTITTILSLVPEVITARVKQQEEE